MAPETGHISEAAEEMAALGGALEARAGWPSNPCVVHSLLSLQLWVPGSC